LNVFNLSSEYKYNIQSYSTYLSYYPIAYCLSICKNQLIRSLTPEVLYYFHSSYTLNTTDLICTRRRDDARG
ncbi:hypothetical protein COCVIDRAFT_117317, partial [Bipolaris victoriae FI3]